MSTRYTGAAENLRRLAAALKAGELVAVPSETVYGLAADALNEKACREIFRVKGRPADDPLIVHLPPDFDLTRIARPPPLLERLRGAFWPGPLTVILEKKNIVPDIVTAGLPSVAVRTPAHPVLRQLLELFGGPLAAPSANPFAGISPTTAAHVEDSLGDLITHILDGGPCLHGIESTILDIRDPRRPAILRHGAIPLEQIETVLDQAVAPPVANAETARLAPGQMARHYSPNTPLELVSGRPLKDHPLAGDPGTALLFFRKSDNPPPGRSYWLSEKGSPREAAANLFAALREIDRHGHTRILAETAPDTGLGLAINDRLKRAAR